MFSRSIEFPDSNYYFEINDQSYGRYGGLTRVQVSRDSIEAHLEPLVVKEFGDENLAEVKVEFMVDDKTYQSVLDTLKNIFVHDTIFVVK
jgi:hypothetical protein